MTSDALLEALSDAVHAAELTPSRILLPENRSVHLNGVRFHYLDWGNPHLPHVVLLHGDGLQAHTWDLAALLLRDRYHLVALSLRGHGDSGWSAGDDLARDSFDLLLDDTRAFIEHLNYDKLTLVGGLTAYRYAAHYPERLTALAILDAAPELNAAGLTELARQRSAGQVLATFDDFWRPRSVITQSLTGAAPLQLASRLETIARRALDLEARSSPNLAARISRTRGACRRCLARRARHSHTDAPTPRRTQPIALRRARVPRRARNARRATGHDPRRRTQSTRRRASGICPRVGRIPIATHLTEEARSPQRAGLASGRGARRAARSS